MFQTEKEHSSALLELILKRNKGDSDSFRLAIRMYFSCTFKYGKGAVPVIVKRGFNPSLWTQTIAKAKFLICCKYTNKRS